MRAFIKFFICFKRRTFLTFFIHLDVLCYDGFTVRALCQLSSVKIKVNNCTRILPCLQCSSIINTPALDGTRRCSEMTSAFVFEWSLSKAFIFLITLELFVPDETLYNERFPLIFHVAWHVCDMNLQKFQLDDIFKSLIASDLFILIYVPEEHQIVSNLSNSAIILISIINGILKKKIGLKNIF